MRFSSIAALSLLTGAFATPLFASDEQVALAVDGPVKTTDSWSYKDCGKLPALVSGIGLTVAYAGESDWPIQLESIEVSPNPPQPGKNLTVTVKGTAIEKIEVRPTA
jgi:hypothetical protein